MSIVGHFLMTVSINQRIIVMTEHFAKWIKALAVLNHPASRVSRAPMDGIVTKHGFPAKMLIDQWPRVESDKFHRYLQKIGIKLNG